MFPYQKLARNCNVLPSLEETRKSLSSFPLLNSLFFPFLSFFSKGNIMGLKEKNGANQMNNVQTWVVLETENCISDDYSLHSNSLKFSSSSSSSSASSSSFELHDDASSHGPLYELSQLMDQLPIKRGLSKYYQGNSRSFGCLGSVKSLEDLAKKGNSYKQRMKSFKSFGANGLDGKRSSFPPKPIIKKKSYSSKRPILSNTLHVANCTSPISLEKNF